MKYVFSKMAASFLFHLYLGHDCEGASKGSHYKYKQFLLGHHLVGLYFLLDQLVKDPPYPPD